MGETGEIETEKEETETQRDGRGRPSTIQKGHETQHSPPRTRPRVRYRKTRGLRSRNGFEGTWTRLGPNTHTHIHTKAHNTCAHTYTCVDMHTLIRTHVYTMHKYALQNACMCVHKYTHIKHEDHLINTCTCMESHINTDM